MSMFHSAKKPAQEKNRNTVKFLDSKKDTHSRLKALRSLLELLYDHEVKPFFTSNYMHIFYVFYEEFTNLELSARSKGAKLKDELEELLVILEKILIFLPDRIHSKWQFNSISLILRKLLHHGNVLQTREQGIRLFMLWIQIMQENIDEFNLAVYASIVPGFPSPLNKINVELTYRPVKALEYIISCVSGQGTSQGLFSSSLENEHEWCIAEGCNAICPPQQGEKIHPPEELTKKFLDRILDFMTRRMLDIQWSGKYKRESGFFHVFSHFKRFYLPVIFPTWDPQDHLYNENPEIIKVPISAIKETSSRQTTHTILQCQCSVLTWLITFTIRLKPKTRSQNAEERSIGTDSFPIKDSVSSEGGSLKEDLASPTNSSTIESSNPESSLRQIDILCQSADIVRAVLYSTQENVLTIYEILRQCFLMPLTSAEMMNQTLTVFGEWFFKKDDRDKPLFVLEPKKSPLTLSPQSTTENIDEMQQLLRTPSYKEAVRSSENFFFANIPIENARAGFQQNLRFFISVSAQIFYVKQNHETMAKHADICRKVMKMYRRLVLEMTLDSSTWRQLLSELLQIAEHILTIRPPNPRAVSLGGQLASYLLQTLFVTWVRASLQVHLMEDLWDHLLHVCSTYTGWEELIKEWAGTMETLTRIMARTVYRIDLLDPPLHQLTRKDRVIKRFQRKVSSGDNLKKISSHSIKSGGKLGQGQNRTTQARRLEFAGQITPSVSELQPPASVNLTRSASEPGMSLMSANLRGSQSHHQMTTIRSDSFMSRDLESQTESQELIPHGDIAEMQVENDHSEEKKKTLVELMSNHPKNTMSFDSEASENVFGASMTSQVFRNSLMADMTLDKESDDSGTPNGSASAISYEPLKDPESEGSSVNLQFNGSIHSLDSYVSESHRTLLSKDRGDFESDETNPSSGSSTELAGKQEESSKPETSTVVLPLADKINLIESESYLTCSAFGEPVSMTGEDQEHSKIHHEPVSPHASVSSETDLAGFEIEGNSGPKIALDGQSLDSRMFIMLDHEIKSSTTIVSSDILEGVESGTNTSDEGLGLKVRFEENSDIDDDEGITMEVPRSRGFNDAKPKSVVEGGTEVGWTPLSSVIVWKRMLGIMGNVNDIKDSEIHGCVFKHLIEIWLMLENVRKNQGVSVDNKFTPPPPALTPPLFFCAPLCFQAICQEFPLTHKPGRVLAFKLLCMMTTKTHGLKLSNEHITSFYRFLHDGLTGSDQDVINAIVSQCSLFYTLKLPSSSCLFLDFIHASNSIISTQYMNYPRKEAVTLLGSLLCLPGAFPDMKIYQMHEVSTPDSALLGRDLRDKILLPLLKAVRNDPSCRARCIAINCLGLFIIESLERFHGHQRIYECLALILSTLDFHSQTVSTVALDVLWTLTFYHDKLQAFDKDLPAKIVEAMCVTTEHVLISREISENQKPEYITRLLLVLLDWVMVIPQDTLLKSRTDHAGAKLTYLGLVMKIFKKCTKGFNDLDHLKRRRPSNVNQILLGESRPIKLQCVHNDLGMDDPHGITDEDETTHFEDSERQNTMLNLTARFCISQVLNFYQHFPIRGGAVCPGSLIYETDDHTGEETDEQNLLLKSNNMQFLLINGDALLTIIELPQQETFLQSSNMICEKTISRMIFRDSTGKYSWDVSNLFEVTEVKQHSPDEAIPKKPALDRKHSRNLSVSSARLTWSTAAVLPSWESVDFNVDRVDQLLRYIGQSSPECLIYHDQPLNVPAPVPQKLGVNMQSSAVTSVLKQHNEEENYVHEINHDSRITAPEIFPPACLDPSSPFHVSKMLLHQLGYFSWEKRQEYELLERNEKLLREIKNLDKRGSRETQKVAVFYVAPGQEDKHSILSNSQGSRKFENFVAGLGWEVDLSTHAGFMGGLEKNLSTGPTAPYYATHSLEVIFHVSTRMPGTEEESLKTKLRHLGNDEVHIIWSEHNRDFRRGIINTEFGDVMIIIYPLQNNLYRIQIDRHPKIKPFGPLFDGAIVDGDLLAPLVRCSAINAGRAKRATIQMFNRHYEERARCIRDISNYRVRPTTFEDFCSNIFAPNLPDVGPDNDINGFGSLGRTFSTPSRGNSLKDPTGVLKLLDNPDASFRGRTHSAVPAKNVNTNNEVKVYRTHSNTSLHNCNNEGAKSYEFLSSSELDVKEYKERRKSITKRFRKKASSVDIAFMFNDKIGE